MRMQETLITDTFPSRDWVLIATLSSLGFPIEAVEQDPQARTIFHIQRSDGLDDAVQRFWRRELRIEPQEFNQHMKLVKARMYDSKIF